MQAPKSKFRKPAYIDRVQIIQTNVLDKEKDSLINVLTNYISDKSNKQTTITNLEKLRISLNALSITR